MRTLTRPLGDASCVADYIAWAWLAGAIPHPGPTFILAAAMAGGQP